MGPEVRDALVGSVILLIGSISGIVQLMEAARSALQLAGFFSLVCFGAVYASRRPISNALRRRRNDWAIAGVKHLKSMKDSKREDAAEPKQEDAARTLEYMVDSASEEDIEWTVDLRRDKYGPEDALPQNMLMEWYRQNPDGFFVIRAGDGRRVGHIDLLPLVPDTLKEFLKGNIKEEHIRGPCLYPSTPEAKKKITDLYVEGIIIDRDRLPKLPSRKPASGFAVITTTLLNLEMMVSKVCDSRNLKNVYAIAATPDGESMVEALGFDLQSRGKKRKDKHNLYVVDYARLQTNIKALLSKHYLRKD